VRGDGTPPLPDITYRTAEEATDRATSLRALLEGDAVVRSARVLSRLMGRSVPRARSAATAGRAPHAPSELLPPPSAAGSVKRGRLDLGEHPHLELLPVVIHDRLRNRLEVRVGRIERQVHR